MIYKYNKFFENSSEIDKKMAREDLNTIKEFSLDLTDEGYSAIFNKFYEDGDSLVLKISIKITKFGKKMNFDELLINTIMRIYKYMKSNDWKCSINFDHYYHRSSNEIVIKDDKLLVNSYNFVDSNWPTMDLLKIEFYK